jgi:hypothetical protein
MIPTTTSSSISEKPFGSPILDSVTAQPTENRFGHKELG